MTERQRHYREVYLRSDHWRGVRLAALETACHRCQVCNSSSDLDVHHRTYERLGCEHPSDLTVLCRDCHSLYHEAPKPKRSRIRRRRLSTSVDVTRLIAVLEAHRSGITIPGIRKAARPEWDAEPKAIKRELEALQTAGRVKKAKGGIWTLTDPVGPEAVERLARAWENRHTATVRTRS